MTLPQNRNNSDEPSSLTSPRRSNDPTANTAIFRHSPIGQSIDCAITGYKYPVHSHFIHSHLQLTSLLPRGETLFLFALILISNQNAHHRIIPRQFQNFSWPNLFIYSSRITLKQFQSLSLPNLFIYPTRNILKTIPKLVLAKSLHLSN